MGVKKYIQKAIKLFHSKEKIAIPSLTSYDELLLGKTALIIGGSGGIGYAIAEKLISASCKVIIAGTDEKKIQKCCEKLASDNAKGIVINLTNVSSLKHKLDDATKVFEGAKIDILINCAGYNPQKGFWDITEEDFDKTMDTNVKGTFFMCQVMAEYMIKNKIRGHILNLSSSSALRPAWTPYEMSKWTIRGLTIGLADSLIEHGIVVNAIAPGPTATPMLGVNANGDIDLSSSPIGRYATPEEIANLALILVSDMGNLVVGDTLYATGGSGIISLHR